MENRGLYKSTGGIGNATVNKYTKYEGSRTDATSAIDFAYKTIDQLAQYARHKTDSFLSIISTMPIDEFCTFAGRNYVFRKRLMDLNDKEIAITLANIGSDAALYGDSSNITTSALSPSYAEKRNYVDNFQREIGGEEQKGNYSTRKRLPSNGDYANDNQIYGRTENLYPDELDSGEFTNKWLLPNDNRDSILSKTKKLFNQRKINTIISAFHTSKDSPKGNASADSQYGLSHGRNLLTKAAEDSVNGVYPVNGYNNPYCRVWTHHHQYNQYNKTIRHFYGNDDTSSESFHKWGNFKMDDTTKSTVGKNEYAWKDESNPGWRHSVLNREVAIPNIAPSYNDGKQIHTKDCMFSIENLAWKGYDPYSFEQALSWEQRGPNGGRIMWFPPYGIKFNENTSARWDEHSFIGRGEPIYTYVNTTRRGTLSFMMIVDHPSIVDYVTWDESNREKVKDTDILRFFAGCGDLKENAKPTPLTDEYADLNEGVTVEENIPIPEVPTPEPESTPDETDVTLRFYVFYPNNYSGKYDWPVNPESNVDAMAYLLAGVGAQKSVGNAGEEWKTKDTPLMFDDLATQKETNGYEMSTSLGSRSNLEDSINYITGTNGQWGSTKDYVPNKQRKWYYRIDGEYSVPKNKNDRTNTYNQRLVNDKNYSDNSCHNLNANVTQVISGFSDDNAEFTTNTSMNDEMPQRILCSFAEFAGLVTENSAIRNKIAELGNINFDEDNSFDTPTFNNSFYQMVYDLIHGDNSELVNLSVCGYSNEHGNNASQRTNNERNNSLAQLRARTIGEWIKKKMPNKTSDIGIKYDDAIPSVTVKDEDKTDVSGESAKIYRSAMVEMRFKTTKVVDADDNGENIDETPQPVDTPQRFKGFTKKDNVEGIDVYTCNNEDNDSTKAGRLWYYDENTKQMRLWEYRGNGGIKSRASGIDGMTTVNKVRYDQEYHFFQVLKKTDPVVHDRLLDKLRYFDPAFHSMTPEGFNGRLTFLQQCLRQGATVGSNDVNRASANNLAFGRQPYCVLRMGDFFNQMIIIRDIAIDYDPLQWDTNIEGIGVQPLLCNVNLSFDFVGGADIAGQVRRLQNAMSFNYYANTSLYDNRADRVNPQWDNKTGGALTQGKLNNEGNYFHNVPMNKQ